MRFLAITLQKKMKKYIFLKFRIREICEETLTKRLLTI